MAASTFVLTGCIPSKRQQSFFKHKNSSLTEWHLVGGQHSRMLTHSPRRFASRVLADPNVSSGRRNSREVIMVDPLEAKRLAAKQMEEIKAEKRLMRRRQIEAINGAWAMIGLTAGTVVEGHTGKSILGQLDGYWHAVLGFVPEEVISFINTYVS